MYSSNKRKDITPKKEELEPRKRTEVPYSAVVVDLTQVDDDDATEEVFLQEHNQPNAARRLFKTEPEVFKQECMSSESNNGSTNLEYDSKCSLPPLSFYRNDPKFPIYSKRNPNIDEIFHVCLKSDVPSDRYVTHKPVRVKDTATFVVNQTRANVKNPKDLDADDTPGAYTKKEQTRFYQVEGNDDGEIEISCEVHVTKMETSFQGRIEKESGMNGIADVLIWKKCMLSFGSDLYTKRHLNVTKRLLRDISCG